MKTGTGIAIAFYFAGFLLTFGHEAARADGTPEIQPAIPFGMMAAVWWPVYWPMRLSYLYFAGD